MPRKTTSVGQPIGSGQILSFVGDQTEPRQITPQRYPEDDADQKGHQQRPVLGIAIIVKDTHVDDATRLQLSCTEMEIRAAIGKSGQARRYHPAAPHHRR